MSKMLLVNRTSKIFVSIAFSLLISSVFSSHKLVKAELETELEATHNEEPIQDEVPKKVVIRKCCNEKEILVELDVGLRTCKLRSDYIRGIKWLLNSHLIRLRI